MLAAILKNQLLFVSAVVHISRIGSAVRHCACNPLSQNTTAHITTAAMDDVICLGRQSRPPSSAFSLYFTRGYFLVKATGMCRWMGRIFTTGLTIMGLHF